MKGFRVDKDQYLVRQLGPNANVLHVGCTNAPDTVPRWNSGTLLHKKLCDHASAMGSKITGIDIDAGGVEFLAAKMPDEKILNVDAHRLRDEFSAGTEFDLIIAGDVIEHLPNPGLFLNSCRAVLSRNGKIIITTANAFGIVRFLKAFLFHEAVHDEHTAYYSHMTLRRLLANCELQADSLGYYRCEPLAVKLTANRLASNLIENIICPVFPQFSEGVIVVSSRSNNT